MTDSAVEAEDFAGSKIAAQSAALPPIWRSFDRFVIGASEVSLFAVGAFFTVMITLEVISRYLFNFSILFINAAARFLLVWFFLLGAGLALRHGAHVGFELITSRLPPGAKRVVIFIAQLLAMVFFIEMVWGGLYSLGPAMNQIEPGLEIRLVWAFLAIPVGFGLLIYHMLVLMTVEFRQVRARP